LCRGEAAGSVGEAGPAKVVHQVRIEVYPLHQLLAGSSGGDVGTIELGEFALSVGLYFHLLN